MMHGTTRRLDDLPAWLVPASSVLLLLVHVVLTASRWQPVIAPDEFGPISIARYLAGVAPMMHLGGAPHMSFGLGLLLAPLFALAPGPLWAYKSGIVLGCLLAALVLPLAYALARHFVSPRQAWVAAIVTALYPALWVQTHYLWNEVALMTGFLALCWLTVKLLERPAGGLLVCFVLLAGFLYALHERAMAVPLLAVALLLVLAIRQGRTGWRLLLAAALLAVLAWAVHLLDLYFWAIGWGDQRGLTPGVLLERAVNPGIWWDLLKAALLQVWYLLAASLGLVLLACAGLYQYGRQADVDARRRLGWFGAFLLACTLASLAASSITMMHPVRGDQFLYGRYNEAFVLPWLCLGAALASRVRGRQLGWLVFAMLALSLFALLCADIRNWQYMLPFNVSGVVAVFLALREPLAFAVYAGLAAGCMLMLWWFGKRRFAAGLATGLGFALTTAFTLPLIGQLNATIASRIQQGPALLAANPATTLAYDLSRLPAYLYYHLQAALPGKNVLSFKQRVPAAATVIISDASWGDAHPDLQACRLGREPDSRLVYWQLRTATDAALQHCN